MRLIFLIVFTLVFYGLNAQEINELAAFACGEKIVLDGKLNEACWQQALPINNFTQREQNEGEPATERTKVAVVYSDIHLYIGVWCYDSEASKIIARQMQRDFSWRSDDNFEIIVSPFNDNRNGYLFVTNPNGAMADVWVGDEGEDFNKDWNGVWDVATTVTDKGWFAEFVIPFSTLKFKGESTQVWGINFERNIRRKNEQVLWQGWTRNFDLERISQAGTLSGLKDIKQGTKIELMPYLLSGIEFNSNDQETKLKVGGEVNVDITPTLKLNFSANTDFAQVESDRQQINLTRFSLFYPEKRQFFLEGKNNYRSDVGSTELFYSRRIGIEQNREVPIIGGVRLFGKLKGTNVGLMSIQTNSLDSIASTNFSVVRIKQDLFEQSSIGVTAMQKYSKKGYNRTFGADFVYSTSSLWTNKNLILTASVAGTETDYENVEVSNKDNLSYHLALNYPNDIVEYDLSFTSVQPDFNPEMGFLRRKNYHKLSTELQFNPRFKQTPNIRNHNLKPIDFNLYLNPQSGRAESMEYEWRPLGFVARSGDILEFNIVHQMDKPEEGFDLIDSVFIPAGTYWGTRYVLEFFSFRGRRVALDAIFDVGDFYTGDRHEWSLRSYVNFNKHLNVELDWQRNFIDLPQNYFITDELGARVEYAFNPKMHTSVFAQWNNISDYLLVNYRINWIPKIGSFFYFVVNQQYDTARGMSLKQTTIMGKLIWRFAI